MRGKIVLADGPLAVVHQLAVEERGAAGILARRLRAGVMRFRAR